MGKTKTTNFQEENKKFLIASLIGGLYPPGIHQLIPYKPVLLFFWYLSMVPNALCTIYVAGFVHHLIFTPPDSPVIIIQILRRAIIIGYMGFQTIAYMVRFKTMEDLFDRWNNEINKDYGVEHRKRIFEDKLKVSKRTLFRFVFGRFSIAQLYNIPLMFNRYMKSSELAGMPHDNTSPYHFYFVAFQIVLFLWIGVTLASLEYLFCNMMTMAEAQVQFLKEKIADILSTVTLSIEDKVQVKQVYPKDSILEVEFGDEKYMDGVKRVDRELLQWILAHQSANRWINDLADYMNLVISLKYIYLGVHCSLVIIGLNGLTSRAMMNDLFLILIVTVGNFAVCFYSTLQADRLYEVSETLFLEAYGEAWYMYPIPIQKSCSIIASSTIARPIVFKGLKNYQDNSENFNAVLQTAYQVLTFILPMAEA